MNLARMTLQHPISGTRAFWLTLNVVNGPLSPGTILTTAVVRRERDPDGTLDARPDPTDLARARTRVERWARVNGWTIEDVSQ